MKYEGREATFEVPESWKDQSVVAFAGEEESRTGVTFALTREQLPPETALCTFASQRLARMSRVMKAFELLDSREVTVAGVTAIQHVFRWQPPGLPRGRYQQATFVPAGGTVLVFIGSAASDHADEAARTFEAILRTVVLPAAKATHASPGLPPPSPPPPPRYEYRAPQGYGPGNGRRELQSR